LPAPFQLSTVQLFLKNRSIAFAIFIPLLLIISCSPSKRTSTQSSLDTAIEQYISGRYEAAREELSILTHNLQGEELCTAYLYLGRSHLALGETDRAAEAFSMGSITCGDELFEEYLMQVRDNLRATPGALISAVSITRAQYACLLRHYFEAGGNGALPTVPADIESHWAQEAIVGVLRSGYMESLPDGAFYPDEPLSRAAFVFHTGRLIKLLSKDSSIDLEGAFPEGVERKIHYYAGVAGTADGSPLISGSDAVNLLDNIARKIGSKHAD
jgi:hypothetical protein